MPCRCGSTTHQRTSHRACPLNRANRGPGSPEPAPSPPPAPAEDGPEQRWLGWVDADDPSPPQVLPLLSRAPYTPRNIKAESLLRTFNRKVQNLAQTFLQDPTEQSWYNLLALPIVLRTKDHEAREQRLKDWPKVPITALQPRAPPPADRQEEQNPADRECARLRARTDTLVRQQRYGPSKRIAVDNSAIHCPSEQLHTKLGTLLLQGPELDAETFTPTPGFDYRQASHMTAVSTQDLDGLIAVLVQRVSKETGMGPYGWSPQLLKRVCQEQAPSGGRGPRALPPMVKALRKYTQLWLKGQAPLVQLTTLSLLLPIDKTKGAEPQKLLVRPICIESLVARIICRAALRHVKTEETLAPQQLGVKSRGGVEPVVHLLHGTLAEASADNDDDNIMLLDYRNAFNGISREAVLDGVQTFCPGLLPFARQLLQNYTISLYDGTEHRTNVGVPQGNVISPFLFSLGGRKGLEGLKARVCTGTNDWQIAYLDDVTLRTTMQKQDVLTAWAAVDAQLPHPTNLRLNADKTQALPLSQARITGINVLGTHVGPLNTTVSFLKEVADNHRERVSKLQQLSTNAHIRIFDTCLRDELTFFLRTLSPGFSEEEQVLAVLQALDEYRLAWFIERAGLTGQAVLDQGRRQATLPRRDGGAGLTPLEKVAPLASIAAATASWSLLSKRRLVPPGGCLIPDVVTDLLSNTDPEQGLPTQRAMVRTMHLQTQRELSDTLNPNQQRLLQSNLSPIMQAAWKPYGPRVPFFTDGEWQILCRSRLLTEDVPEEICPRCNAPHRTSGHRQCNYHYRTVRHDKCRDAIGRAVGGDFAVKNEPHVSEGVRELRADIRLSPRVSSVNSQTVTADLRVVDADSATSYTTFDQTARNLPPETSNEARVKAETTAILELAYKRKTQHYASHHVAGVQPWIFTTLGETHQVFTAWVTRLQPLAKHGVYAGLCQALIHSRALRATRRPY